jgi:hypothetical protein
VIPCCWHGIISEVAQKFGTIATCRPPCGTRLADGDYGPPTMLFVSDVPWDR